MKFRINTSNALENESNTHYPIVIEVVNESTLKKAVSHDYTAIQFTASKRSKSGFIAADCIILDIDNTHSDDESEWKTPNDISSVFPNVEFCVHFSRNNLKQKNGKAARPKFHVIFPASPIKSADEYSTLAQAIQNQFPYFDSNALDSARFFFGTSEPMIEIHEGTRLITDLISIDNNKAVESKNNNASLSNIIPEGTRNNTMFRFAISIITKLGVVDAAHSCYIKESEKCSPHLSAKELDMIWNSAIKIYTSSISCSPGYISPEDFNKKSTLKPKDYSDLGQARLFSMKYEDKVRYVSGSGYIVNDGIKWIESEIKAQGLVQEFSGWQLSEALNLKKVASAFLASATEDQKSAAEASESRASAYLNHAKKYRSSASVSAVMKEIRPLLSIDSNLLDADPCLINTPSHTYDLRLGLEGMKKHDSKDFMTKVTSVDPSDEGMELWLNALDTFFCADLELKKYMKLLIGTAAFGKVMIEALIISVGSGKNGKSTFWNSIATVLGDYACHLSSDILLSGDKNHQYEKAELRGRRLVLMAELDSDSRISGKQLKNLCSTDMINACRKYEAPISFVPSHTTCLFLNSLPDISDRDEGTWRRIRVIPFNAVIDTKVDIKNYAEYLVENAGGAILKWIIEGAKEVYDLNFKFELPAGVKERTDSYRSDSDWFTAFLDSCCDIDRSLSCRASELYAAYKSYTELIGEHLRSQRCFLNQVKADKRFTHQHLRDGNVIIGLRFK